MDPSYIPEWSTRFTDKMTFFQRVQNVLSFTVMGFLNHATHAPYQRLKLKYNIKTEFSMLESMKQAKLWIFNGNYPFEFPRPMQPNMIFTNPQFESTENQTVKLIASRNERDNNRHNQSRLSTGHGISVLVCDEHIH